MARHVDRADLLEPEVPLGVRVQERPHEAAARAVDVHRDVDPALLLDAQQEVVDADDVVGVTGERRPDDRGDADRVLVEVGLHVVGPDDVLAVLQRDDPRLDVEVAAELVPHDVHVAAEDEVRPVGRLALGLAPLAPLPLQRERAEHDRLRRALRPRARRLARGVEEAREHPDAALLDLRGLRVLGVIDEVAVQVGGDQLARLRLHPRGDERGEVAHRLPVELELLADQAQRIETAHAVLGQRVVGRRLGEEPVAVGAPSASSSDARRAWCASCRVMSGPPGIGRMVGRPQQDGADEEARGAERRGPVGGGEVEDRPRVRHDVRRDRGHHEQHAAREVDHGHVPPPALVRSAGRDAVGERRRRRGSRRTR